MLHLKLLLLIGIAAAGHLRVTQPLPRALQKPNVAAEERARREKLKELQAEQQRLQAEKIRLQTELKRVEAIRDELLARLKQQQRLQKSAVEEREAKQKERQLRNEQMQRLNETLRRHPARFRLGPELQRVKLKSPWIMPPPTPQPRFKPKRPPQPIDDRPPLGPIADQPGKLSSAVILAQRSCNQCNACVLPLRIVACHAARLPGGC